MNFISIDFILFVSLVVLIYFLVPKKLQWVVLLAASYAFYFITSLTMSVFLIASTAATFGAGILIGKINIKQATGSAEGVDQPSKEKRKQQNVLYKRQKRIVLLCVLVFDFGMLCVFKYFNFFAANINSLLDVISVQASIPRLNLLLPLGISFYIFQSAGYLIDVYRGKYAPDRNFAKYALFVSFFPQIVQGPIGRYDALAHQLVASHKFDYTKLKHGAQLILWGLFKKLVIADRAAILVNQVFGNYGQYEGLVVFVASVVYCVQIYADFSGGIDIATGAAQMMGIELARNFRRPYFSRSISEFWQRWHITLGAWMRDYLFYPMCLSRPLTGLGAYANKKLSVLAGKILPACIATFVVFIVIGIWHEASWRYIAYGLYNGILISLALVFSPLFDRVKKHIRTQTFGWRLFQTIRTFLLICIGRFFTRAASFTMAVKMLRVTITGFNYYPLLNGKLFELGLNKINSLVLIAGTLVLFIVSLLQERGVRVREKLGEQCLLFRWAIYFSCIFAILIFGIYGLGYNASDFIYMGF